jgi:DNA primase
VANAPSHRPRRLAQWLVPDAPDDAVLDAVVRYYHGTLTQNATALGWLGKRGLNSPEVMEHFRLGFADRSLGLQLPEKNRMVGAVVREKLQRIGLYRPTGHEHFNGCIVVPITDAAGNVVQAYGYKRNRHLHEDTEYELWLPGRAMHPWNLAGLAGQKAVIITRTVVDALSLWVNGYRAVTFTDAVAGDLRVLAKTVQDLEVAFLTIVVAADDAALAAAVGDAVVGAGIGVWKVILPSGMSVNKYALKHKKPHALGHLLAQAEWIGPGPQPERPVFEIGPVAVTAPMQMPTPVTVAGTATMDDVAEENTGTGIAEPHDPPAPETRPVEDVRAVDVVADEVIFEQGDRRYRVRGLLKNTSFDLLKVNLAAFKGDDLHIDSLDLYSSKQRAAFVRQAASELHVQEDTIKADIGRLLRQLEVVHERHVRSAIEPVEQTIVIPPERRERAIEFLQSADLLDRIVMDFEACGLVGESTNLAVGYLVAISRKLDQPLAAVVQSASAAGKSSLMEAVLDFVPPENRLQFSEMTGQSLFYLSHDLRHKVLAIAEEQGAERVGYSLKLLQSEGHISIASTAKETDTGRMTTEEYRVEGPVALFFTTTAAEVEPELQNRCIVLSVSEHRDQTRAIHRIQREAETLDGLKRREARRRLVELHQDVQRMLQPVAVVNPFAPRLGFLDDRVRARRDHKKYLGLIRTIAFLHQYQRPIRTVEIGGEMIEYIEVTLDDIEIANRLAALVLGRSLDELASQTRRLLVELHEWVRSECRARKLERADFRFGRRQLQEAIGWTYDQLRVHLARLVDLEYVVVHRGGRGQRFEYELLYDGGGQEGQPFVLGLVDASALTKAAADAGSGASHAGFGVPLGADWGVIGGTSGAAPAEQNAEKTSSASTSPVEAAENARPGVSKTTPVVGVGEDRGGRT